MTIWAVIAARSLEEGKSRLAGALEDAARNALNLALLTHVIEVVRKVFYDRSAIVSSSQEILQIGSRAGLVPIHEGGSGLNQAFGDAAIELGRKGANAMLALPSDLPMLAPTDLEALVAAAQAGRNQVVIAPDRHGLGTNALLTPLPPLEFRFGSDSRHAHEEAANRRGWTAAIVERPGLAWDLDTPADLAKMSLPPQMLSRK